MVAVASFALADSSFVGVEGDYVFHTQLKDSDVKIKDSRPAFGIKAGYDFDTYRVYGSYTYGLEAKENTGYAEIKWKNHKFLVNADYTPQIANDVKLIAGLYTGASVLKIEAVGGDSDSASDWLIGARLGTEYSIDENNAIEAGFKYDYTKFDIENDNDKIKQTDGAFYIGYNYKF